MQDILKLLEQNDQKVTSQIIHDAIAEHAVTNARVLSLYNRYKAEHLPIHTRTFADETKINRIISNSFDSEIVDTKVGYFLGNPISYQVDESNKVLQDMIQDFNNRSNIDDLDAETVKIASICGYVGRLLYIDLNGEERAMLLYPWEVIPIYDRSINELQYAIRYYPVTVKKGKDTIELMRVEWYDNEKITYYIQVENSEEYVLDDTAPQNPQPHLFDGVPIVIFVNNEEMQGDAEKVLSLIDAYDRTFSDVNSEIEEFRLAYMAFYGYEPTLEVIQQARKTGAFGLDTKEEGVGIEFITKQMFDDVIEHHLDRLENNINRFAKNVNMSDEAFGGNLTGVAIKYKTMPLENKCATLERKMISALRNQYKLLSSVWAKKGITFNYLDVFFTFKRNLPVNIADEADSTGKLKGMISERTRLSLLSFVDDVEWEIDEMEKEQEAAVDLDFVEADDDLEDEE